MALSDFALLHGWRCPTCGIQVPEEAAECPACAIEAERARRRERRRQEAEHERARLGLAPLTRSRCFAYWALVSAGESLTTFAHYAAELDLPDASFALRALEHVDRARSLFAPEVSAGFADFTR